MVIAGKYFGNRTFPGLNDYISALGCSPYKGSGMKRRYGQIAAIEIRNQLKRLKITKPIWIDYTFYEVDSRRDKGNIFSFADKVFEDALQTDNVIPNDGWKEITGFSSSFKVDKENPRIEILMKECET